MPPTSRPAVDDARAAELAAARKVFVERVGIELLAAQVARTLAAPAELLVPVIRTARGRRGVSVLPGLASQGAAVVAGLGVRAIRGRGQFRGRRALVYSSVAVTTLAPLVGLSERGVVLGERSPLWGIAVQAAMTVPVSLGVALTVVRTSRVAREERRRSVGGGTAAPSVTGELSRWRR